MVQILQLLRPLAWRVSTVRGHQPLIHIPRRFHDLMTWNSNNSAFPTLAEQFLTGQQLLTCLIQWILAPAPPPQKLMLDLVPGFLQRGASQLQQLERIHHLYRMRQFFHRCGLEPGEAAHRNNLQPQHARQGPGPATRT